MKHLIIFLCGAGFTLILQHSGYAPAELQTEQNVLESKLKGLQSQVQNAAAYHDYQLREKKRFKNGDWKKDI
jgi:hypothetical protein